MWINRLNLYLMLMRRVVPLPNFLAACIVLFMDSSCKVVQINPHHGLSASLVFGRVLATGDFDIALIQEPWTLNGKILGLNIKGYKIFYDATCVWPRACILISSRLNMLNLINYLDGENVAIRIIYEFQGHKDEIILMSSPLLFEEKGLLSEKIESYWALYWG